MTAFNGLGLPNDESLKLSADYFENTINELIPNKSNEESLASKNKIIDQQKKVIIAFAAGCAIGLFILGFIFIEPLRTLSSVRLRCYLCAARHL